MPSDSGERRPAKSQNVGGPPLEQEHLPCPRCDSTNTKFCYYNNYNLSQPRHFCKSCRRYWTQGGTLRNIPVGGGSRKQAKRSRTTTSANNITSVGAGQDAVQATPISASSAVMETETQLPLRSDVTAGVTGGSFTALLGNTQGSSGVLALGGFGLGIGSGFEDLGFELGRGVWPLAEVGEGTLVGGGGWGQFGGGAVGGDGGFGDQGECFAWPELAISTPRKCGK